VEYFDCKHTFDQLDHLDTGFKIQLRALRTSFDSEIEPLLESSFLFLALLVEAKSTMACERCRVRKVKCDNVRPSCVNCVQRTIRCVYVNERQKRRKLTEAEIESRLHRVESLVRIQKDQARVSRSDRDQRFEPKNTSHRQAEATNGPWHLNSSICGMNSENEVSILEESPLVNEIDCNIQSTDEGSGPEMQSECGQAVGIANRFHECNITSGNMLSQILSDQDPTDLQDENTAVWIRVYDGDEYTGPSSGISFLSAQGLNWVRGNAGRSQALCSIFEDLKNSVRNYLRVPKCVANDTWACDLKEHIRKPLPSTVTIWTYINSYFESVQCIFPVLDRTKFESRTREYLSSTSIVDTAWYALLNAVLASGCRAALSAETADAFRDSGREGWAYFQNALAVEAELVHKATSLAATQALAVMTVYAQSISSPLRLEYTLSSTAVRLAQSIGLHRKSPSEWNLSFEEQRERNRTFWVIYCLDKTVALRCGRPCILDDADISCPFPRAPRSGQGDIAVGAAESAKGRQVDFDFFLCYARYARICGIVAKDLYSATGLSKSCDELTSRAAELLEEINTWKQTIPDDFRPGKRFRPSTLPDHVGMIGGLALHFGYSYIICAVYRRFSTLFERGGQSGELRQRRIFASSITAVNSMEAARSMILMTKHLDIESYSPAWYVLWRLLRPLLLTLFRGCYSTIQ
jgi:Fungal specific transcription factor domain/Fungal Zn(2)-Cys(6) binuclear cluster domain